MNDQELIQALRDEDITNVPTKWVSVAERLPEAEPETATFDDPDDTITYEISECVLAVDREGKMWVARYKFGPLFQGWQCESGRTVEGVTYWMPLPEPPSTEGAE